MEWTPKQHIEHQQLLERMERERLAEKGEAVQRPVKKKKKTRRKARSM